jgi:hypothetical protein
MRKQQVAQRSLGILAMKDRRASAAAQKSRPCPRAQQLHKTNITRRTPHDVPRNACVVEHAAQAVQLPVSESYDSAAPDNLPMSSKMQMHATGTAIATAPGRCPPHATGLPYDPIPTTDRGRRGHRQSMTHRHVAAVVVAGSSRSDRLDSSPGGRSGVPSTCHRSPKCSHTH